MSKLKQMFVRPSARALVSATVVAATLVPGFTYAGPRVAPRSARDAFVGTLTPNLGKVVCTGSINSNGTIATQPIGNVTPVGTAQVAPGVYQVAFNNLNCADVRAVSGAMRIVQPDLLNQNLAPPTPPPGTQQPVFCTVEDSPAQINAVLVRCWGATPPPVPPGGNVFMPATTSFSITVTK